MKTYMTIWAILFLVGCAPKTVSMNKGIVMFLNSDNSQTVNLRCTGYGKTKDEAKDKAVSAAFYSIFFRGISGSTFNLPMIPDETTNKDHAAVKKILNGENASFINGFTNEAYSFGNGKNGKDGYNATIDLIVNCDALRRYLEEKKVLRKFGY